jgi:hypothetical protein
MAAPCRLRFRSLPRAQRTLRAIAREFNLSVETVRDIAKRMERSPVRVNAATQSESGQGQLCRAEHPPGTSAQPQ